MREHFGATMNMRTLAPVLMTIMLLMAPCSLSNPESETMMQEEDAVSFASAENTSGWLASAGGANQERIHGMVAFPNGSTLVGGMFEQNIEFNGDVIGFSSEDSDFGIDYFLAWIDEEGNWTATASGSSSGLDGIDAMTRLSDGTVVVAGTFCGMTKGDACNLTLGDLSPLNKSTIDDENAVFLAAMTPIGEWLWATSYSNLYQMSVVDLLVTSNDEIHLAVLHRDTLVSGDDRAPGSITEDSVAILVLDSYGNHMHMHTVFSSENLENSGALCLDYSGQTYFATTFLEYVSFGDNALNSFGGAHIAVGQYNSGGWLWAESAGGTADASVSDCKGRFGDGVAIVGDFSANMTFDSIELGPSVWIDFFEAHISSNGSWLHATAFGGDGADHAVSLHITEQGDSVILGKTSGTLVLGEYTLTDIDGLNDGNHHDVFLGRRQANASWDWAISAGGSGDDIPDSLGVSSTGSMLISFISNQDGTYGAHDFDHRSQYDMGLWLYETDLDLDGVLDGLDNCPKNANNDQANVDGDSFGDVCDEDIDGDDVLNDVDDCRTGESGWLSDLLSDHDGDGCRDLTEDLDDDEDGVFDEYDLCPKGPIGWVSTEESDIEGDGCSDLDSDGDGFVDQADNCPSTANPNQADLDDDGIGDVCDADKDGDSIPIPDDNCPNDIEAWVSFTWNDYDADGCQDETADEDDDDDAVLDENDACPMGEKNWGENATSYDNDGDGCHDDLEDDDDDNDGIDDALDRCPRGLIGPAQTGQDKDSDGCIDAVEDDDDDQDGVLDPLDKCPNTNLTEQATENGCSSYQLDDDEDGVANAFDFCLNTAVGSTVDKQGCETTAAETAGETEEGGSMATLIFLLAGVIAVYAAYTALRRPGPALPKEPVALEHPMPDNDGNFMARVDQILEEA